MIAQRDAEGFGGCTQIGECTAVCPKSIQLDVISQFDHDALSVLLRGDTWAVERGAWWRGLECAL